MGERNTNPCESDLSPLLADREFQNLLLTRLKRTVSAHGDAADLITLLVRIADLLEAELR